MKNVPRGTSAIKIIFFKLTNVPSRYIAVVSRTLNLARIPARNVRCSIVEVSPPSSLRSDHLQEFSFRMTTNNDNALPQTSLALWFDGYQQQM